MHRLGGDECLIPNLKPLIPDTQLRDTIVIRAAMELLPDRIVRRGHLGFQ